MITPLRIGCVPYLNARPVVEWFHSTDCDIAVEIVYAVPSRLAVLLRRGDLDAALVSTVELFLSPGLLVVPDISISADGPVRSVRLFSSVAPELIQTVALDSGSLTSVALTRIILSERYGVQPQFERAEPNVEQMLLKHDAGLVIGDLHDPDPLPAFVLDLGREWKELTGLPFCYAAWLANETAPLSALQMALSRAKRWGIQRTCEMAQDWAQRLSIPFEKADDYLSNTIQYDLSDAAWKAVQLFQEKCIGLGLAPAGVPVQKIGGN